jgi:hypothetical protein
MGEYGYQTRAFMSAPILVATLASKIATKKPSRDAITIIQINYLRREM